VFSIVQGKGRPSRRAVPTGGTGRLPGKPKQNVISTKGDIMGMEGARNGFSPLVTKYHIFSVYTAFPYKGAAGFFIRHIFVQSPHILQ